jgi:putative ABC transport system permease protein
MIRNILPAVRIALRALRVNKLRAALTMLGIIIGVGAVIATVSIGSGAEKRISDQIKSIGSNMMIVLPGSTTSGGLRLGFGSTMTLSEDDARAIAAEIPVVQAVAPSMRGTAQAVFGNQNWSTIVQGATPDFLEVRDWNMESGRFIAQEDLDGATKVVVLGRTVVENLFGDGDPLDQIVRIKKVPFTVIGVLNPKGQSAWGQDQDDIVIIPLSTAKKKVLGVSQANARMVGVIAVKVRSGNLMQEAEGQITDLLRQRHRLQPWQDNDFSIRNLAEIFRAQEESSRTMRNLLGAVAAVSLLVGGIGIMNIMLVSVTERTREIGIRMAVGARTWDIRWQFLVEAVTLALIGGLAGVALGIGGSAAIAHMAQWATLVSPVAVAGAFVAAAATGLLFGLYPAWRASLLNPIEALRYE